MFLKSKAAVVTGSTSGIGLACARALAKEGADVLLNGFGTPEDIERERAAIEAEFGVRAVYSPADMTRPDQIAGMIEQAVSGRRSCSWPRFRAAATSVAGTSSLV